VGEQKKPDRLKNDSHHQKGVATNIKGLRAIKHFIPPKRSGNNDHKSEGTKAYLHHQKE
jgi:hypothetical protein